MDRAFLSNSIALVALLASVACSSGQAGPASEAFTGRLIAAVVEEDARRASASACGGDEAPSGAAHATPLHDDAPQRQAAQLMRTARALWRTAQEKAEARKTREVSEGDVAAAGAALTERERPPEDAAAGARADPADVARAILAVWQEALAGAGPGLAPLSETALAALREQTLERAGAGAPPEDAPASSPESDAASRPDPRAADAVFAALLEARAADFEASGNSEGGDEGGGEEGEQPARLLHEMSRVAGHRVAPGGLGLPDTLGRASAALARRLLVEADGLAEARRDALIRAGDLRLAVNRELPHERDEAGALHFFGRTPDEGAVALAACELDRLRALGPEWRLLREMHRRGGLPAVRPLDPFAGSALAEAVALHLALTLRVAGRIAAEAEAPFVSSHRLREAGDEIALRRLQPDLPPRIAPGGSRAGTDPDRFVGPAEEDRGLYRAWGLALDDPAAHYRYGTQLFGAGQVAGARSAFERALALQPGFGAARFGLGELLFSQGRLVEAIPHFEAAAAAGGQFEAPAHTRAGRILGRLDRGDEALPHFERAVELNPDQAETRFNLGLSYARHGRRQEALAEMERAVELDPDMVRARRQLAALLNELGRHREAEAHYKRLVEANDWDPVALHDLAATYEALGERARAREAFERSLAVARRHGRYRAMVPDLERKIEELSQP